MRTSVPPAFEVSFDSPEGGYRISFQPTDDRDGRIDVSMGGRTLQWEVVDSRREDDGSIVLGGMTTGTEELWNGVFWFELRLNDSPPVIRYWGDRVIWREDHAIRPT